MGTEEDARKLFVAGLPDTVTDEGLRSLFQATGVGIDELSLPRDRTTGRPRGFAFVTLTTADDAVRAREQLDGSLMDGRSISVRPFSSAPPARGEGRSFGGPPGGGFSRDVSPGGGGGDRRPPPRDDSGRTLYVGNLPYDIEEADLRGLFTQMGAKDLDRIHLPMDHATGRKRGFAFVSFINEDAAKASLDVLGDLNIRGRQCTVHIAHPRGERPPPRAGGFGGGPGGGMRNSAPPPGGRSFGGGGFGGGGGGFGGGGFGGGGGGPPAGGGGFGGGADRGGRPPARRGPDEFADRAAKGMSKKKRLEEEKRRGGGNARRYMEEDWDEGGED
jgi:RNA recognition motif-containing protein